MKTFITILILAWASPQAFGHLSSPDEAEARSQTQTESQTKASFEDCLRLLKPAKAMKSILSKINNHASIGLREFWPIDGTYGGVSYSINFAPALKDQTLEQWALHRKQMGFTTHTLDLFGSAVFTTKPELFDSLTGVRLRPMDQASDRVDMDLSRTRWQEVYGDILKPSTWQKIRTTLKQLRTESVDLITIHPVGPLSYLTSGVYGAKPGLRHPFHIYAVGLLNKAWQILSNQNGIILVRLNRDIADDPEFHVWIRQQKVRGVDIEYSHQQAHVLRLMKTPSSPSSLLIREENP